MRLRFCPLAALLCAFAALLPSAPAHAQGSTDTRARTSLSLGAFLPTQSDTRTRAGSALLHAELRYAPETSHPSATRPVLSVTLDRSTRGEGTTLIGGTLGYVVGLSGDKSPFAGGTAFAGYGGGLQAADLNGLHASASLAGYAELGYNLTPGVFAQTQYRVTQRVSGFSVTLGARF